MLKFFDKFIERMVWLFYPKTKLTGVENIPDEPVVFVSNHAKANGPIISQLYMPVDAYTWTTSEMMHWKEIQPYAYKDFWSKKPGWIKWFYKLLSYLIVPIAYFVMNEGKTIAVYHDVKIMKTLQESSDKLSEGKSLVIFPESYEKYNPICYQFHTGFVDVARFHYKKTGQVIKFVPMYLAPKLKLITFGTPISYDPNIQPKEEKDRICKYLMDTITDMAAALPRHKVVPYPNMSKKYYPYNDQTTWESETKA